jgi:hypothetical protein
MGTQSLEKAAVLKPIFGWLLPGVSTLHIASIWLFTIASLALTIVLFRNLLVAAAGRPLPE